MGTKFCSDVGTLTGPEPSGIKSLEVSVLQFVLHAHSCTYTPHTHLHSYTTHTRKHTLEAVLINRKFPFKNSYWFLPGHYRPWRR